MSKKLSLTDAKAVAEYLRKRAASGLLSPDPSMPDSEITTAAARGLPRLVRLAEHAANGDDVAGAARDVLEDREPQFLPTTSASLPAPGAAPAQPGPTRPTPLTTPPRVGDIVHVFIEGVDGVVVNANPNGQEFTVEFADGTSDLYGLADLGPGSPPSGVTVQPGPHGTTAVSGLPTVPAKPHNWSLGDRVRSKKHPAHVGSVAVLPSGPVVQLAGHTLGNEMGVDLDGGGRAVADVDEWEAE